MSVHLLLVSLIKNLKNNKRVIHLVLSSALVDTTRSHKDKLGTNNVNVANAGFLKLSKLFLIISNWILIKQLISKWKYFCSKILNPRERTLKWIKLKAILMLWKQMEGKLIWCGYHYMAQDEIVISFLAWLTFGVALIKTVFSPNSLHRWIVWPEQLTLYKLLLGIQEHSPVGKQYFFLFNSRRGKYFREILNGTSVITKLAKTLE